MDDSIWIEEENATSEKKYIVSVILAAVFGILGIHHFYLERWLLGILDLSLSILSIYLLMTGSLWGLLFLLIDIVHSVVVTYLLLVGKYKDGKGKLIPYPGQKSQI